MTSGFYGNDINLYLPIDKIYPNYTTAQDRAYYKKKDGTYTTDEVFLGRYVLINYNFDKGIQTDDVDVYKRNKKADETKGFYHLDILRKSLKSDGTLYYATVGSLNLSKLANAGTNKIDFNEDGLKPEQRSEKYLSDYGNIRLKVNMTTGSNITQESEFTINIPELGNAISKMWDIVYGKGKDKELRKINLDRNDTPWSENGLSKLYDLTTLGGCINACQRMFGSYNFYIAQDGSTAQDAINQAKKEKINTYFWDYDGSITKYDSSGNKVNSHDLTETKNGMMGAMYDIIKESESRIEQMDNILAGVGRGVNVGATSQIGQPTTQNEIFNNYGGVGGNTASGSSSHAEGWATQATGNFGSHSEGDNTKAFGQSSHAEGYFARASGAYSHAGGNYTIAAGDSQTAIGKYNIEDSTKAFIIGNGTGDTERSNALTIGWDGDAEFSGTVKSKGEELLTKSDASSTYLSQTNASNAYAKLNGGNTFNGNQTINGALAQGSGCTAGGQYSHAEGVSTETKGPTNDNRTNGLGSHAEGRYTYAEGLGAHAEGNGDADDKRNIASGIGAHCEGYLTSATGQGAHAEGRSTIANGDCSHAEGQSSEANAQSAHAEGGTKVNSSNGLEANKTTASGVSSHAEGSGTTASGHYSHAEGVGANASGAASHAEGGATYTFNDDGDEILQYNSNVASGAGSHAEGYGTKAEGRQSHAEGYETTAGDWAHAEGVSTNASGSGTHTEGGYTAASGTYSHAEGNQTRAEGSCSHAEGQNTIAYGGNSHSEGYKTKATGTSSHAEGGGSQAKGESSHAEGGSCIADGSGSHAEGWGSEAEGTGAHAEGKNTIAKGQNSLSGDGAHAEGSSTQAYGEGAHAEGYGTLAQGNNAHAEGDGCQATNSNTHAEGYHTQANGARAHAEGYQTVALFGSSHIEGYSDTISLDILDKYEIDYKYSSSGDEDTKKHNICNVWKVLKDFSLSRANYSHCEGKNNLCLGRSGHAEGELTAAYGNCSHSAGQGTVAKGNYQTAIGRYNKEDENSYFIVGIGTGFDGDSKNGFRVSNEGQCYAAKGSISTGADFAEYFEWKDGNLLNEDRCGLFVTLEDDKIKLANLNDNYILGAISSTGAFIGNSASEEWQGKYLKNIFGEIQYEEVEIPEEIIKENIEEYDEETGEVINIKEIVIETIPARMEKRPILNPEYSQEKDYIPRENRSEWDVVGLCGQIIVVDDGTCEVNGYCYPGQNGIGTKSDKGYRVMKRLDDTHIKVLIK